MHEHFALLGLPTDPDEVERILAGGAAVTGQAGYDHRLWGEPSGVRVHTTDQPGVAGRLRTAAYAGPVSRVVPVDVRRDGSHPLGATLILQPVVGSRPDLYRIPAVAADLAHTLYGWRTGVPVGVRLTCWPSLILGRAPVASRQPGDPVPAIAATPAGVRFTGTVIEDRHLVNEATGRPYRVSIVDVPDAGLVITVGTPVGTASVVRGAEVEIEGRLVVTYADRPSDLVGSSSGCWLLPVLTADLPTEPDARTELVRAVVAAFPHHGGVLAVCHRGDGGWEARRYPGGAAEPDLTVPVPHTPFHATADADGIAVHGDGALTVIRPGGPTYTVAYPAARDCQVALGRDVTWLLVHGDEPAGRWTMYRIDHRAAAGAPSTPLADLADSWVLPVVSPPGVTPVPTSRLAQLDFAGGRAFAALPHVQPDGTPAQCHITVGSTGPPGIEFATGAWTRARVDTGLGPVEHTSRDLTLAGQTFPPGPGAGYGSWRALTATVTAGVVDAADGQVVYLLRTPPGEQPTLHRHQVGRGYVSYAADASRPDGGAWFLVDRFQRSEVYVHDLRTGDAGRYDFTGSLRLITGDAAAREFTAISVNLQLDPVLSLADGTVGPFSAAPLQGTFGGIVLGTLVRVRIGA